MKDSRKLFRIGKSLNELDLIYKKVINEMAFSVSTPNAVEFIARWGYCFYWLFDNLVILNKLKFFNFDMKSLVKKASLGWFIGSLFMLVKFVLDLNKLLAEKSKEEKANPELEKKIFNCYLNIIGKIGDLIPSSNGIELPHKIIGRGFTDFELGVGGFVASLIALRNAWYK